MAALTRKPLHDPGDPETDVRAPQTTDPLAFLSGGGEAARMIRARDWSSHPLGPPARWPAELRTALSLVLNAPESMILAWGPGLHFFFNDTCAPLLGRRAASAMGERFDKVWADTWDQAKPIIEAAMAGRAKRFVDLPWTLESDRGAPETWWTFSYSRVLDARGEVAGLFIVTNETTERVRGGAALRDSETRYRTLFDSIDEGFCIIEFFDGPHGPLSDYVHVEANPAYAHHTGIPNVVGQKVRTMVPDEAAGWVELYGGVLRTGEPIRFERELVATRRHLELAAFRVEPASRRQVAVLFKDVTARVRAEQALAALNASLQSQVEERTRERDRMWTLSRDLFLIVGQDGSYKALNPTWERDFGHAPDELTGLRFDALVHPDDAVAARECFDALVAGTPTVDLQCRLRRADGEYRTTTWTCVATEGGFYCTGRDVTDQLKTEEALRQSQKMEAVGQLTGGLAHDFNNLLAGISGSLDLMSTRLSQGRLKDVDKYVVAAQGATKRAAALTHRLLAFSRRQTLDPRPTNANALVGGMEDMIRRTVGPAVAIEVIGASGAWPALVDPPQLENALLNLCINARDAMPEGGRLTIETANRWFDPVTARQQNLPPGQYLSLCVTDTGIGMSADIIAKAFDPFFTTKPIGQGTGLGLSMIYGFAQQSGGQVRIYSEVGKGTTVCIYLPRHLGAVETVDPLAELAAPARAQQGETVLVVDDEPTVRMLITEVLEDLGYTAIEAADSTAGLKVLQSDVRIDLVVTDVGLPGGMNGRQMVDAVRAKRPSLKVLFITGYAENAIVGNGHLEPGMQVLTKPFAVDALAARIRELVGTRAD